MTQYIMYRTGKLLFPRLARDQRKHRMSIIGLVMITSLFTTYMLVSWMKSGRH